MAAFTCAASCQGVTARGGCAPERVVPLLCTRCLLGHRRGTSRECPRLPAASPYCCALWRGAAQHNAVCEYNAASVLVAKGSPFLTMNTAVSAPLGTAHRDCKHGGGSRMRNDAAIWFCPKVKSAPALLPSNPSTYFLNQIPPYLPHSQAQPCTYPSRNPRIKIRGSLMQRG